MKQYFICLANSFKYGGRCVAGIEIVFKEPVFASFDAARNIQSLTAIIFGIPEKDSLDNNGRPVLPCLMESGSTWNTNDSKYSIIKNEDGTPKWIRPVSCEEHRELSTFETQNINILDIVEIEDTENCPDFAHSENVYYSSLKKSGKKIEQNANNFNNLCDNTHSKIFFNKGKAVPTDVFQQNGHSLMFIKIPNCTFYNDENEKLRVKFSYNGIDYDLPVTDPAFINYMQVKGLDHINTCKNYYFTISLGEEFEGWHYKLVAGVLSIPASR